MPVLRRCDQLVIDVDVPLTPRDWSTFPESILCQLTAGGVFHDDLGLAAVRDRLANYPPVGGIEQIRNVLWKPSDRRHLVELLDS